MVEPPKERKSTAETLEDSGKSENVQEKNMGPPEKPNSILETSQKEMSSKPPPGELDEVNKSKEDKTIKKQDQESNKSQKKSENSAIKVVDGKDQRVVGHTGRVRGP